jgi:metal-sulfur cluster biosynthetic enzyme
VTRPAPGPAGAGAPGAAPLDAKTAALSPDDPVSAAWNALAGVYDPELYLDVVSLGLVYDVRVAGQVLVAEMTMTTPGCPVSESLPEEARSSIRRAVGDGLAVDVRVVWDPPWDPSMMTDAAAAALGFGRA